MGLSIDEMVTSVESLDAYEPHAADCAERGFRHGLDRLLDGYAAGMRRAREWPAR
jgi:hypothetical protein